MDSRTVTTTDDLTKTQHPKPTDFDIFLPWACKEFSIASDVIVTRAAQKTYASALTSKRKINLKPKKQLPKISSPRSSDETLKSSSVEKPEILAENIIIIETVYDVNENLVQLKFLKNKAIPRKVMQVIALTIPYQPNLTSITINRGLSMDSLYEISKFLPNSHITELCLDSTFLSQAKYYILLLDSKLKHLSLAKCMINDAVVKTIADQLNDPCPASKALSALNLSCNRITDVGAKYIADMLRTNRTLSYLNLAGNMITDDGGIQILDILHEFPLNAQELLESRTRHVTYLKQRNTIINTLLSKRHIAKFDKSPKKKVTKRAKLDAQSLPHVSSQKRLIDLSNEAQIMAGKAEYMADKILGLFNEPFSPKYTKLHDGVVYCIGNYTLCYLNFAYNNLTYASLKKLHEVLSSQKSLIRTPGGLIKVVIEGNLMPVTCKKYREIDQLLDSNVGDILKESDAVSRRKTTSKSSTK